MVGLMSEHRLSKEANLPLEVVMLLVAAMTMLIVGGLLFPISTGALGYYEDGLYGLLLVILALQMITLGKTPFGDARRTGLLLALGATVATVGIVTCFVPDLTGQLPRWVLVVSLGAGGLVLLLRMALDKQKYRTWFRAGGILRHLIAATGLVYGMSVLMAVLLLDQDLLTVPLTASAVLVFGASILYLAGVLRVVYRLYPEAGPAFDDEAGLSTDRAMMLLIGIFMVLLGVLLVPVNFGSLPFSGSAQLGLLMVIFVVQMLATGSTPIGGFRRSWLVIAIALVFAALGIVSTIIPNVLVVLLTVLVGVLNILGGAITLATVWAPLVRKPVKPREPFPPLVVKLGIAQTTTSALTVMFGLSMLVSQLIPGLVLGVVLATNGCVLLYELRILISLDRQQGSVEVAA